MAYSFDLVELVPQSTYSITLETTLTGLEDAMDRCFPALYAALQRQGLAPAGPPFARSHAYGPEGVTVEVGCPVNGDGAAMDTPVGEARPSTLPGGEAVALTHVGPYDGLPAAYQALTAWLEENGRQRAGGPWENYVVDPNRHPDPSRWRTRIVQPLAPQHAATPGAA